MRVFSKTAMCLILSLGAAELLAQSAPLEFVRVDVATGGAGVGVHVCALPGDSEVPLASWEAWHTIRAANGRWQKFGNVRLQFDIPQFSDVACVGIDLELHLVGVTKATGAPGGLLYLTRSANGTWQRFWDLLSTSNIPFQAVSLAQVYSTVLLLKVPAINKTGQPVAAKPIFDDPVLHVCGVTTDGGLWHTIRSADGKWQNWGNVKLAAGAGVDPGKFTNVGCAGINGDLHIAAVTIEGGLWHTIRFADGTWQKFGDVRGATGSTASFQAVSVAGLELNKSLHVCGVTTDGGLWHTIRSADGKWQNWGNVKLAAGDRGKFTDVGCAGTAFSALHLVAVTTKGGEGGLWHTIRFANGTWQQFGDVKGETGLYPVPSPPTPKPPQIVTFKADPNGGAFPDNSYITLGDTATLTWQVSDCGQNCTVSLNGFDGLNYS